MKAHKKYSIETIQSGTTVLRVSWKPLSRNMYIDELDLRGLLTKTPFKEHIGSQEDVMTADESASAPPN